MPPFRNPPAGSWACSPPRRPPSCSTPGAASPQTPGSTFESSRIVTRYCYPIPTLDWDCMKPAWNAGFMFFAAWALPALERAFGGRDDQPVPGPVVAVPRATLETVAQFGHLFPEHAPESFQDRERCRFV